MIASRVLATLLVLATAIGVCGSFGFRVNLTASLPLGVYRVSSEPPSRGSIVQACLPRDVAEFARTRGYLGPGSCPGDVRPIGKIVLAVAGDVVTLTREEIRVNGRPVPNSRPVGKDSRGRPLPHFARGAYRLGPGELGLHSPYHRSAYDSRYFGPVRQSDIVSVLRPLRRRARNGIGGVRSNGQSSSMRRGRPSHDTP